MNSASDGENGRRGGEDCGEHGGGKGGKNEGKDNDKQPDQQPQQSQQPVYWYPNGPGQTESPKSGTEAFNERYRAILGIGVSDAAPGTKKG